MPESASAATDLDLISYLKAIPDARMRRGVRIPAWYMLLVAVLLEQDEHWQLEGRRMFSPESMAAIPSLDDQPALQAAGA